MSAFYFSGRLLSLSLLVFAYGNTVGQPPSFVETPPRLILYKTNDSLNLTCLTAGTSPISILWKKNGGNLDLNASNILRQDDDTIHISPTTQLDEGYYQCIAENKYGATVSDVFQLQRAVIQPTGLTQLTNHLEAIEGQPFMIPASTFKVIPKSKSSEQYVWMKYAGDLDVSPQRIVPDRRIKIAENGDLHFANILSSDDLEGNLYLDAVFNPFLNITIEGNYTRLVVKSNESGVQQFPSLLLFSSISRSPALEGENVTMRCFFSGRVKPVRWFVDKVNYPVATWTVSNDGTESTLINVTKPDEMSYYCQEHEIYLKIEASPRFVELEDSPQQATVMEKDSAAFRCNATAEPEADIVWLFNGKSLSDNPRKRFAISADRKTLTISLVCRECKEPDGVDLSDSGVIQCNASNVHGYALGTGYLDIISIQKGEVQGSAAQENSVPFEFAFAIILTIMVLISF